ncbi:hypothetical protein BRADI_3g41505v3, partial [Brachypodium distachyon]
MSWIRPYAEFCSYPSWDKYDSRAHYPSHSKSSHPTYMQLQEDQQSHVIDRFNRNESVRSSKEKKEVTKQVYRIKKDVRECVVSDSISNNKEPVKLTLATKGEEMKNHIAKSEITKKVPKIKKELPLCKAKSQPGCPLGLSSWQDFFLQRLSAEELKKKNMAW